MDAKSPVQPYSPMSDESDDGVPGFAEAWRSFNMKDALELLKELGGWEEYRARIEEKKRIRKEKIENLEREVQKFENKVKFAVAVRDSVINIRGLSSTDLIKVLKDGGFVPFPEKESEEFQGYSYIFNLHLGVTTYPEAFDKLCAERDLAKATLAVDKIVDAEAEEEEEDQFGC